MSAPQSDRTATGCLVEFVVYVALATVVIFCVGDIIVSAKKEFEQWIDDRIDQRIEEKIKEDQ